MVDVEQIFEILDVNKTIADTGSMDQLIDTPAIEFRNVSFKYIQDPDEPFIIDDISFKVPANHKVALVGATGAGKSTIMRLLYRFYEGCCGDILINGVRIQDMTIKNLRDHIAIVPQDCVLFNDTVKYNIAYGSVKDEEF